MLLQSSSSFGLYFHEAKTNKPKLHHIDTRFLIEVLLDTEFESLSASKKNHETNNNNSNNNKNRDTLHKVPLCRSIQESQSFRLCL